MNLKQHYTDSKFATAFTGKEQFYRGVKEKHSRVSRKAVNKFLISDDSYTLHAPVNKPQRFRRVQTKGIGYLYQIDLVDMSKLARENKGYKWLITCIDTFSKYLWTFSLKNKKGSTVTNAMRSLLTSKRPQKIETDGGTEFKNRHFRELLKNLKIKTYSIYSDRKCSIVERVNRTLKTRMYRMFTSRGRRVWINDIQNLVDAYNSSYHRSIKRKPNQVNSSNEAAVRSILFPPESARKPPKLKIGDTVRITRKKNIFMKGYEQSWSYEVFYITDVKRTIPITYEIRDYNQQPINGSFYESEVQLIDKSSSIYPIEKIIRKRRTNGVVQYLVKYQGYSHLFNSWINQSDLFNI